MKLWSPTLQKRYKNGDLAMYVNKTSRKWKPLGGENFCFGVGTKDKTLYTGELLKIAKLETEYYLFIFLIDM